MADSGVDTSNENSDNSLLDQSQPLTNTPKLINNKVELPQCMIEFNAPAIPINEYGQAMPVGFFDAPSTHDQSNKMKCTSKARYYRKLRADPGILAPRNIKLNFAVSVNDTQRVHQLILKGADPNYTDDHKRTPLHIAACKGYEDMVRLLLNHGANPNKKDILGNTPLHLAACSSNIRVINQLLDAGTDVSALDRNGRNPMQLAESKLRMIQKQRGNKSEETKVLIDEIGAILNMMLKYQRLRENAEARELEVIRRRLEQITTLAQVDKEVQNILDNIDTLKLK